MKADSVQELYFFAPSPLPERGRHSATGSFASVAALVPAPFHSNGTNACIIQAAISLEWIDYRSARLPGYTLTNRYVCCSR